jgi:hypothetical protein
VPISPRRAGRSPDQVRAAAGPIGPHAAPNGLPATALGPGAALALMAGAKSRARQLSSNDR